MNYTALGDRIAPTPGSALTPDIGGDEIAGSTASAGVADTGDTPPGVPVAPADDGTGRDQAPARSSDTRDEKRQAGAPPASEPARFLDSWRQEMAGGDKAFLKTLDRFDSPVALAKAYRELTAKLSSGELKSTKPLGENASPQEIAAWRTDHALPESAAAYVAGLTLPGGMIPGEAEQPLLASFAEQAMRGNWTAEQYNQAVGWYFAMQDRLLAERQRADGQFKEQSSSHLLREWGTDYAVNRNAVVQFFDRYFPQELKISLLTARLPDGSLIANHPGFNKAILEVAKIVSPSGTVLPNASGAGLSSVDGRIAEIEGRYMRAAHGSEPWKTYWTGEAGAHMQQEYRGLLAQRERARRDHGA
jgi:hypothetical protein